MLLVFNDKFGQSLLEIIIAIAIFSLIGAAIATMVTGSLSVLTKGGDQIEADALAQEAIEAVRSVHDGAWNEIIYDSAVLSTSSSQWIISSGLSELIGSRFTRTITFEDVCRDSLDNIDICPSNYVDVNSKKVTVIVSWEVREGVTNSVQRIAYLTNWDSRDWVQTDWVDGNGQIEWSDPEMYDFSIDINTTDTAGQITLADEEDGSWTLSGGKEVIDTTDIDFNSGLFTDIIVRDIDVDASLILATTTTWALHNDSSSTTIEQLNDISFISTSSAWAVGDSGKILNFTGLSWLEDSDIGTTDLNGIDMISDSDGWAVGDGGERYKYNGTTWAQDIGQAVVDATDADFNLGEFSGTEVSGIGDEAKLILSQSISWAEHGDSGSISIDINDISIVSSSDIWAGADSGKIIHFNGVGWTETIDLGNSNVNGIKMRTSSDGWAVGNSGKIWHYNGTNWNEDDDTGRETWNDVAPIANNDVWVVGEGGSLARYDGSSWIEYDIPNSANIESIFAISSSDIWAVGASGRIWHYDGASWSLNIDTGNETWYGLVMLSASSGWAVGSSGRVAEYNGITWTESTLPSSADILEVHAISSSNIWATGASGRIWHYDGASWSLNIDIGNEVWNGISMAGADEGWVVGDDGKIYQLSTFYNNSGTFLSQVFDSGIEDISWDTANWTEVLPPGADLTIAVRTGNTSIPDGSWTSFTSENTNPITSDLNVLEGRYLQYRATLSIGDSASESPELEDITINYAGEVTTQNLNAISTVSSSDIWAVGQNATIIHYDGNLWTSASTNISEDINGIDMLSTSDGWAVGDSGKILRFQNGNWSQYSDTGREIWNSVAAINANDAWAVGNDGKIAHFNGSSWTESTIPSSAHILAVHALTSSNIWAVGDSGRFWRYGGNNWALELDTGGEILRGIEMISASSGWVIGSNGVIYEYGVFYYNSGVFESRIIDSGEAGTEW
ncbi:hypothetical protein KKC44_06550, partial [Patescibacteria group bacterium]|nr:hypothetical protein [Patescibacteria group bacterium]